MTDKFCWTQDFADFALAQQQVFADHHSCYFQLDPTAPKEHQLQTFMTELFGQEAARNPTEDQKEVAIKWLDKTVECGKASRTWKR